MTSGEGHGPAKAELRARLLAARTEFSTPRIEQARSAIRRQVLSRYASARFVAAYRPLRTEPCSVELLDALASRGVRVIVPLVRADGELDWLPWPPADLDGPITRPTHVVPPDALGVDALARVDVVFVPALAVDRTGVRLGRGAGYYDRALRRVRPGVPIVALLHDGEFTENLLPADEWDIRVTAALSPSGWHSTA